MKHFKDGDQLVITRDDFVDLQDSPAYFIHLDSYVARTILKDGFRGLSVSDLSLLRAALAAKEATGKHIAPPATATEIRNAIGCAPEDIEAGISALECQHLGTVNSLGLCTECHKPIVGG